MSDEFDRSDDTDVMRGHTQEEVDRAALVDHGKRLAALEARLAELESVVHGVVAELTELRALLPPNPKQP